MSNLEVNTRTISFSEKGFDTIGGCVRILDYLTVATTLGCAVLAIQKSITHSWCSDHFMSSEGRIALYMPLPLLVITGLVHANAIIVRRNLLEKEQKQRRESSYDPAAQSNSNCKSKILRPVIAIAAGANAISSRIDSATDYVWKLSHCNQAWTKIKAICSQKVHTEENNQKNPSETEIAPRPTAIEVKQNQTEINSDQKEDIPDQAYTTGESKADTMPTSLEVAENHNLENVTNWHWGRCKRHLTSFIVVGIISALATVVINDVGGGCFKT